MNFPAPSRNSHRMKIRHWFTALYILTLSWLGGSVKDGQSVHSHAWVERFAYRSKLRYIFSSSKYWLSICFALSQNIEGATVISVLYATGWPCLIRNLFLPVEVKLVWKTFIMYFQNKYRDMVFMAAVSWLDYAAVYGSHKRLRKTLCESSESVP